MESQDADKIADSRPVKAMATPAKPVNRLPEGFEGAEDDAVISALGSALVVAWEEVPQDLQRVLFEHAAAFMRKEQDMQLREKLARFLHDHKESGHD